MNERTTTTTATDASDAVRLGENRFGAIVGPARGDDECLVTDDGLPGHLESELRAVNAHCAEEAGGTHWEPA